MRRAAKLLLLGPKSPSTPRGRCVFGTLVLAIVSVGKRLLGNAARG